MARTTHNIYDYNDYRQYLRDAMAELKACSGKYSLRYLASKLGLRANSHLKMVMDGKHNVSPKLATRLAEFFELDRRQTEFFMALVNYNQAKTQSERTAALDILRGHRPFRRAHQVALDQFDYYNDPLLLALRELVAVTGFKEDARWIRSKLDINASGKQIHEAIDHLLRMGLLARDADGKLVASDAHITSGHGLRVAALKGYYVENFARAAASLEIGGDVRHVGGMTMSISPKTYDRIVALYDEFLNRVREEVDADETPDSVYQLVFGLFPYTKPQKKSGGK